VLFSTLKKGFSSVEYNIPKAKKSDVSSVEYNTPLSVEFGLTE
jgi:hypothetical protein